MYTSALKLPSYSDFKFIIQGFSNVVIGNVELNKFYLGYIENVQMFWKNLA